MPSRGRINNSAIEGRFYYSTNTNLCIRVIDGDIDLLKSDKPYAENILIAFDVDGDVLINGNDVT